MRKALFIPTLMVLALVAMVTLSSSTTLAAPPTCEKISGGNITSSGGDTLSLGYDEFGYNYQAHMFVGYYGNYTRPAEPVDWGYSLMMWWNDPWLANVDCDGDGLLDRYYGFDSYIGSGAWLTNHMRGEYTDEGGNVCKWTYFVKIVAAPADATSSGGIWFTAGGTEIGPVIWGAFAIVQQVENDLCAGLNGANYVSPHTPGFGVY